ncbi:MAG: exodeoxyribonuclease VII small subunit [Clostridiales bacterium]|nr:exodeoxyribonuclease VII small subunit [Clostridiales bacterium]
MENKLNYNDAMDRLQKIVEELEGGKRSLDESLKLFEEGTKLAAFCRDALDKAEQKITELSDKTEE